MILPCGLAAAPARVSVQAGKGKALTIDVIYGLHGSGSLESFALTSFLASRYRAKTASLGSTLFRLIWKTRVTPSGRSIPALRASGRRTSGSGSTSWPTPCVQDGPKGGPGQGIDRLPGAAAMAAWPTPNALPMNRGGLQSNPQKALERREQGHQLNLDDAATLASWPTPMAGSPATDTYNEAGNTDSGRRTQALVSGLTANGSPASTEKRGQLNPYFSLWLQGLPTAWGSCGERVMRSARRKPSRSSKATSK
jgi:hypothetical protein